MWRVIGVDCLLKSPASWPTSLGSFENTFMANRRVRNGARGLLRLKTRGCRLGRSSLACSCSRAERLVEADVEAAAFEALKLMDKLAGPKNVRAPASAAVSSTT